MKLKKLMAILFSLILFSCVFSACDKQSEPEKPNYPVAGIWHASASWHEITQSTILGKPYELC